MKTSYAREFRCVDCKETLHWDEYRYSLKHFKILLCRKCQDVFRIKSKKATDSEIALYQALVRNGVRAELQKCDGNKTVDIVVEESKVHIEVDGEQHNTNANQALSDLKRTYHSLRDGYVTLRIPNSLIDSDLREAVHIVKEFLEVRQIHLTKTSNRISSRGLNKKAG